MFSWICPQCGHDVPPSKTECPYCAERAQQAAAAGYPPQPQPPAPPYNPSQQAPPAWQPPAPPPPPPPPSQAYQQPPQPYPPQAYPPQYAAPPHAYAPPPPQAPGQQTMAWPPPQKKGAPTWMVGGGVAIALLLVFGGLYYFLFRGDTTGTSAAPKTASAAPAGDKAAANPLQKSIEVTGLRFTTEKQKPTVRFIVVNHSSAPVSDLQATVNLLAGTSRSDEDQIGSFNLIADVIPANGSKELSAPLKTKLKAYELPDWQNATAEVQITSPAP